MQKASNKYMNNYDKSSMESYILYLDANNWYGCSVCEYQPKGYFKWNTEEWTIHEILKLQEDV